MYFHEYNLNNSISPQDDSLLLEDFNMGEDSTELLIVKESQKRKILVAPWLNVDEFRFVYDSLFSVKANTETRNAAMRQMDVWKTRRSQLTPAAVLATMVLLDSKVKDEEANLSESDLQVMYASAFSRFYNYMSSIVQTRNPKSIKTMYGTAKELGIHSFIVDLRHLCSHGQVLPPLKLLRKTSDYCLNWLKEFYWTKQMETIADVDTQNLLRKEMADFDERISKLYTLYEIGLESHLKGANDLKMSKQFLVKSSYEELKLYYKTKAVCSLIEFLNTIVKDMGSLIKNELAVRDSANICTEAFLQCRYLFIVPAEHCRSKAEKAEVFRATQSLFRMLSINGLIEELFFCLLKITENEHEFVNRRRGASFWANEIVKGFMALRKCKDMCKKEMDEKPDKEFDLATLNYSNTAKNVRQLLKKADIDIKGTLIFGDTVQRPWTWTFHRSFVEDRIKLVNDYNADILKNILELVHPRLSEKEILSFKKLIEIQFESSSDDDGQKLDTDRIYTIEDLQITSTNMEIDSCNRTEIQNINKDIKKSKSDLKTYGIWSTLPNSINWSISPIGKLPWQP